MFSKVEDGLAIVTDNVRVRTSRDCPRIVIAMVATTSTQPGRIHYFCSFNLFVFYIGIPMFGENGGLYVTY